MYDALYFTSSIYRTKDLFSMFVDLYKYNRTYLLGRPVKWVTMLSFIIEKYSYKHLYKMNW